VVLDITPEPSHCIYNITTMLDNGHSRFLEEGNPTHLGRDVPFGLYRRDRVGRSYSTYAATT
jgi:hypothetical protein